VQRLLALAALSCAISGAAQAYFWLRSGFLQEMLKSPTGFQVAEFVGLTDALGVAATFNRESLVANSRLALGAAALALALGLVALLGRRTPLLAALAAGAALYQGYTAAHAYYYGFYKGIMFEIPVFALLIGAGAALAWERASETRRPGDQETRSGVVSRSLRFLLIAGLGLVLGLNAWTAWGIQRRYTAAGPQLWSLAETDVADVRAEVPAAAAVLIVPPGGRPAVFNSLLSYTLLGHDLMGRFKTGYDALDWLPGDRPAGVALLADEADPANYGYRAEDVRWAGAGMRLYGRAPGVLYHRALGSGGRYPALAPGASLTLRVGPSRVALPGETDPAIGQPASVRLSLAIASFEPTAVEIGAAGGARRYDLPGGLVQLTGAQIDLPAEVRLRNAGTAPAYLWWAELCDPATPAGAAPRDDVFVQVEPVERGDGSNRAADILVHTAQLPAGAQKLTAVVTISHKADSSKEWKEVGQWVFFPAGARRMRLDANLETLAASLQVDGRPGELVGAAQPDGDGAYRIALLLANNARIVYGTTLWDWRVRNGVARDVETDTVNFDVVPLPRPATPLEARSGDGLLRLRGYTMPRRQLRPGEKLSLSLVWQGLGKIPGDLSARVALRDAGDRPLAEQRLPLGARDHGTSRWQEGEVAEQEFAIVVPQEAGAGDASVSVELVEPDGKALPFEGGEPLLKVVDVEIVR